MDLLTSRRTSTLAVPPDVAWDRMAAGGPGRWYADAAPFRLRGTLDRLVGGADPATPPDRRLRRGDDAGFWYVESAAGRTLVLRARVRAPGTVTLTSALDPAAGGCRLTQAVTFRPHGLLGAAYLFADLPAREVLISLVHARTRSEVSGRS